mgnify:CR=1 FL=1
MGQAVGATHPDEAVLSVANMHCGGCVRSIERALGETDGVLEARANLTTKRVRVRFDEGVVDLTGLVRSLANAGFEAARFDGGLAAVDDDQRFLLRCLSVAGFAAANIMLLSVAVWAGLAQDMEAETRDLFHWLAAAIALPTVAYSGRPFFRSAWTAVKVWRVNMDVPISLAVLLATGMSLWQTAVGADEAYFDAAVSLLFFLLIGRFLDARVRGKAREAAGNLLALAASEATVIDPLTGAHRRVTAGEVRVGDRLLVATGEKVPADGHIRSNATALDTTIITGETLPSAAAIGDAVYAGSVNLGPAIEIDVIAMADDSLLADIGRLMETAQQGRDRFVHLADRAAKIYAPLVHTLGALTFAGWMIAGVGVEQALITAVAVLIITCPCALGLAVPAVQVVAAGRLMRRGILVKSGAALERFAEVDRVVFDKTGTLTLGQPAVQSAETIADDDLRLAASLASVSRHPLSQAIVRAAAARLGPILLAADIEEMPGAGIRSGDTRLGSAAWCRLDAVDGPVQTTVWLTRPNRNPVAFRFADRLRPDAANVVAELQRQGLSVALLSGDAQGPVAAVAAELGIADARAGLKPNEKIACLEAWQRQGERILMVGDGLNDAPALAAANASMSPASAADISQTAADMIFQSESLAAVVEALRVSRASRRRVLENFSLAAFYNVISIPLAMAGFVTPLLAAIAMSSSSIFVTANALRLRSGPKPWTP